MKRLGSLLIALALVVIVPEGATAGPTCGANEPELRLYSGTSQGGTMLGAMCAEVRPGGTIATDNHMGDSFDTYRGSDNDTAASFKFYNPTSAVWCVVLYVHSDFRGDGSLGRRVYSLGFTSSWWGPSGGTMGDFNNLASSVQIYRRSSWESAGVCNGL